MGVHRRAHLAGAAGRPTATCRLPFRPCPPRQGIPTLVLTNADGPELARAREERRAWNETWEHHPDAPFASGKPGDLRAASGPSAALRALGPGFRWLLYGDDDVAFFWPGLLAALEGLDPEHPYFITGETLDTAAAACLMHLCCSAREGPVPAQRWPAGRVGGCPRRSTAGAASAEQRGGRRRSAQRSALKQPAYLRGPTNPSRQPLVVVAARARPQAAVAVAAPGGPAALPALLLQRHGCAALPCISALGLPAQGAAACRASCAAANCSSSGHWGRTRHARPAA